MLYRCKAPTDLFCACGSVGKALRRAGVDYETRRVGPKRKRPEILELTGQKRVPVLVDGDEVIHDSRRIREYVELTWGGAGESDSRPERKPGTGPDRGRESRPEREPGSRSV